MLCRLTKLLNRIRFLCVSIDGSVGQERMYSLWKKFVILCLSMHAARFLSSTY